MKLGIVTVYQSYNCGSFLQAYALHRVLTKQGHTVSFLRNSWTVESRLWYRLLQAAKYISTRKPKRAKHLLKVYNNFRKARKTLSITPDFASMAAVIYGSDTIWNTDDTYFLKHRNRFFGADYDGVKIAYAASIGSTSAQELLSNPALCNAISSFRAIGVRDTATLEFVKACYGDHTTIESVIDPTMLLPRAEYEQLACPVPEKGYILFYHFGAIAENVKKQVRDFADKTGRKIVVIGENVGWADAYVSYDPYLMLSYYQNADYIITNTFHGNVFSLIFNKQFISFGKNKAKVCSLLEQFGLSERLVDPETPFSSLFDQQIDHSVTNKTLETLRQHSLEFLKQQLSELEDT